MLTIAAMIRVNTQSGKWLVNNIGGYLTTWTDRTQLAGVLRLDR